jgi:hypothetical protein
LANALGDLQDQPFADWEAIVVNDARLMAASPLPSNSLPPTSAFAS